MEKKSYSRFWRAFSRLSVGTMDREEVRRDLVSQFSLGRTESLRDLSEIEYRSLCERVEELCGMRDELRRLRSMVLRQMQQMGVDTSDWRRVDALCLDSRISGKCFGMLWTDELKSLHRKLKAIERSGGFRRERFESRQSDVYILPMEMEGGAS